MVLHQLLLGISDAKSEKLALTVSEVLKKEHCYTVFRTASPLCNKKLNMCVSYFDVTSSGVQNDLDTFSTLR